MFPRRAQAADHIRRRSRCGDTDQHILPGRSVRRHIAPRTFHVVLGMLHGPPQSPVAPGDQADHTVERHAVGRGQFRSVGDGQPAARARTDIKHASAALHALDDAFDQTLHHRNRRTHGFMHACVFAVDTRQDVVHRHPL